MTQYCSAVLISQESPQTPHANVTRGGAKPLPLTPAGVVLRRCTAAFHLIKLQWPFTWSLLTWPLASLLLFCAYLHSEGVWCRRQEPSHPPGQPAPHLKSLPHPNNSLAGGISPVFHWRVAYLQLPCIYRRIWVCAEAPRRACGNLSPHVILLPWQSPGYLPSGMKINLQVTSAES